MKAAVIIAAILAALRSDRADSPRPQQADATVRVVRYGRLAVDGNPWGGGVKTFVLSESDVYPRKTHELAFADGETYKAAEKLTNMVVVVSAIQAIRGKDVWLVVEKIEELK